MSSKAGRENWVPDKEALACMECKTRKFDPVHRRHHCRQCGKVCCGQCSRNRKLVQSVSDHPVRVCDSCFSNPSGEAIIGGNPSRQQPAPAGGREERRGDRPVGREERRGPYDEDSDDDRPAGAAEGRPWGQRS